MVFNDWYEFFFENKGVCPYCKEILTMHIGCTNVDCQLCKGIMESDRVMKIRISAYDARRKREVELNLKRLENARKRNLDKSPKKRYIKIDD